VFDIWWRCDGASWRGFGRLGIGFLASVMCIPWVAQGSSCFLCSLEHLIQCASCPVGGAAGSGWCWLVEVHLGF
jgi:hypothetical protein